MRFSLNGLYSTKSRGQRLTEPTVRSISRREWLGQVYDTGHHVDPGLSGCILHIILARTDL